MTSPELKFIRALAAPDKHWGHDYPTLDSIPQPHHWRWRLTFDDVMPLAQRHGCDTRHDLFIVFPWPYGRWQTVEREVLFDRRYTPMLERRLGGDWQRYDGPHWVDGIVRGDWLYGDGCLPWRNQDNFDRLQLIMQALLYEPAALGPDNEQGRHEQRAGGSRMRSQGKSTQRQKARARNWYRDNRARKKATSAAWYARNRRRKAATSRAYYAAHREHVLARIKAQKAARKAERAGMFKPTTNQETDTMSVIYEWSTDPADPYQQRCHLDDRCALSGQPLQPPFMVWRAEQNLYINAASVTTEICEAVPFLHDLIELMHAAELIKHRAQAADRRKQQSAWIHRKVEPAA